MNISLTRPESFILKKNGQKTYSRITDFAPQLDNPIEQKAFSLKNSNIIRQIVDNPKIQNVSLDMYYYDCVNRIGTDRYDEPDMVYGVRVRYEQPLTKNFMFIGEYRWETSPTAHSNYMLPQKQFIARVATQNLPKSLFGDTCDSLVLYKEHNNDFGDAPVDTSKYTNLHAVIKYKAAVMKKRAKK